MEIEETINVQLNQDGGMESMELKGEFRVEILKPEFSHIYVNLQKATKDVVFRVRPLQWGPVTLPLSRTDSLSDPPEHQQGPL